MNKKQKLYLFIQLPVAICLLYVNLNGKHLKKSKKETYVDITTLNSCSVSVFDENMDVCGTIVIEVSDRVKCDITGKSVELISIIDVPYRYEAIDIKDQIFELNQHENESYYYNDNGDSVSVIFKIRKKYFKYFKTHLKMRKNEFLYMYARIPKNEFQTAVNSTYYLDLQRKIWNLQERNEYLCFFIN